MIQFYPLSVIYLAISSLILLPESWNSRFTYMIIIRGRLREEKRFRRVFLLSGLIIGAGTLFFPISPGPRILGDLIPAFMSVFLSLMINFIYSDKREDAYIESLRADRFEHIGKLSLLIALIHFLFPHLILV